MTDDPHTQLIDALNQLAQILLDEDEALRRFDTNGIGRAADRKAELEPVLARAFAAIATAPSGVRRQEIVALRERIATQAHANLARLQASSAAVRSVLDRVTGKTSGTYGRGRANVGETQAVLASEVG